MAARGHGSTVTCGCGPSRKLGELAALLVGIHGQHEQALALASATQTTLLDAYARHPGLLDVVRAGRPLLAVAGRGRDALLARATSPTGAL